MANPVVLRLFNLDASQASVNKRLNVTSTEAKRSSRKVIDFLVALRHGNLSGSTWALETGNETVVSDATSIAVDGGTDGSATFTRTGGTSFVTLGFEAGQVLLVEGAETGGTDGAYLIVDVTSSVITVETDKALPDNAEDTTVDLIQLVTWSPVA